MIFESNNEYKQVINEIKQNLPRAYGSGVVNELVEELRPIGLFAIMFHYLIREFIDKYSNRSQFESLFDLDFSRFKQCKE